jgi:hypothetical protein
MENFEQQVPQQQSQMQNQPATVPVQPTPIQSQPPQYFDEPKPKKSIIIYVLFGIILLVFAVGGTFFYLNKNLTGNTKLTDSKFEFQFSDTKGWKKIPPKEGSYISLATVDQNNTVISYADVRPLVIENFPPKIKEEVDKLCREVTKDMSPQNLKTEEITINNISEFKCEYEVFGPNINETLISSQYTLYNSVGKKYGYIITTSYPKKSADEASKVIQLIEGFSAL